MNSDFASMFHIQARACSLHSQHCVSSACRVSYDGSLYGSRQCCRPSDPAVPASLQVSESGRFDKGRMALASERLALGVIQQLLTEDCEEFIRVCWLSHRQTSQWTTANCGVRCSEPFSSSWLLRPGRSACTRSRRRDLTANSSC